MNLSKSDELVGMMLTSLIGAAVVGVVGRVAFENARSSLGTMWQPEDRLLGDRADNRSI